MLINLRNALMTGKRLPYDAEVEYLECTGTQYIDTGRPIPTDFWFDATIDITGTNNAYKTLLGARFASTVNDYQFSFQSSNNYFLARYGGGGQYYSPLQTGMARIRVESGGKLYINESSMYQLGVGSPSTLNVYIFALNTKGAVSQQAQYIRLYSLKYGGLNEDHDLIPVRKGTVGYLYDRVSGKLFGNAGTGDFVLGPDVVPVEYIESHGAEWIDTGIKPNQNTGIKLSMDVPVANTTWKAFCGCRQLSGGSLSGNIFFNFQYQSKYCPNGRVSVGSGSATIYLSPSFSIVGQTTLELLINNGQGALTVNGTTIGTYSISDQWAITRSILLLAGDNGGIINEIAADFKLKNATILNETSIVANFRPVRVGTDATSWEGAMIDTLTRRIYRNAGSGAFSYGNDLKYPIPA